MKLNLVNASPAFCGVPVATPPLSRFTVSAAIAPRRNASVMRLRKSSKAYNAFFDRSKDPASSSASDPSVPATTSSPSVPAEKPVVDSIGGNGAAPPHVGDGNGRWDGGGDDGGDGWSDVDAEVAAVLRAAGREVSSLPADARGASAEQVGRLLAVERMGLLGWAARVWPGLRNRLVANERLPIQMGVELSVGCITKTLAEVQGRGERFWKEFDFYVSDLALELVGDAMLVWLLCPTAVLGGTQGARGVGGFLQGLPKHAGQLGGFSWVQRASTLVFKAVQFGVVGFASSVLGHGATTALVKQRRAAARRRGEEEEDGVELAPVVRTSAVWGLFMLASSNSRYQVVNAVEQRALDPLLGKNKLALTVGCFALRFANCFVGGVQWLPFARHFGIQ